MAPRLRLCYIVDLDTLGLRALDAAASATAVRWAAAAAGAGVDWLHLRSRAVDARRLSAVARRMAVAVEGSATAFLVNDRADVALAIGAAGVHLPAAGLTVGRARELAPAWTVGRSAHDAAELASAAGADYVIVGTIFTTPSKPGRPGRGCQAIADAVAATAQPVLAIGGITAGHLAACRGAGAAGVAGIRLFGATPDALPGAVAVLQETWDAAKRV